MIRLGRIFSGLIGVLAAAGAVVWGADGPRTDTPMVGAARAAESALDATQALRFYLAADREHPGDPFVLQKISKQYSDTIVDRPDPAGQRRCVALALAYAQRAAALDPADAAARLAVAISYGKLALLGDPRTRIDAARQAKVEAERALALDPSYAWAHHVLGRWHVEVSAVGSVTRFFAALLYGPLPDASLKDAIQHLRQAVALAPACASHHIELGMALARARQTREARSEIEVGLALPSLEKYDEESKRRGREWIRRPIAPLPRPGVASN